MADAPDLIDRHGFPVAAKSARRAKVLLSLPGKSAASFFVRHVRRDAARALHLIDINNG